MERTQYFVMLISCQSAVIATALLLPALTSITYVQLPIVNGTSAVIPTDVDDPTLPQSSIPDASNTTPDA